MFIKPMPGVLVRDPVSKELLPPGGRNVEESGFWLRRIAEGAVEIVSPQLAPEVAHLDEVEVASTPQLTADQPAKKKDARK